MRGNTVMAASVLVAGSLLITVPWRDQGARPRRRFARLLLPEAGRDRLGSPDASGRLARVEAETEGGVAGEAAESSSRRFDPRQGVRQAIPALTGLATALLVGGWPGLLCAIAVTAVAARLMRGVEPASVRAERVACAATLPLAADLLAAALRGGAPVERSVEAVGVALGGPLGARLTRVARALALGAEPVEAWAHLADTPGSSRMSAAAIRSSSSGGALAGALTRLADDLRADRAAAVEAAARRAGVLIVLPLGLCFLPAFVLAGLAPVVVAVLGDVL